MGRVEDVLALLQADAGPRHLAVLDIDLHGEPSYPVADALAARGVRFVLTTGFSTDALHPAYRGCTRMEKPVSERGLLAALTAEAPGAPSAPFAKDLAIPS